MTSSDYTSGKLDQRSLVQIGDTIMDFLMICACDTHDFKSKKDPRTLFAATNAQQH